MQGVGEEQAAVMAGEGVMREQSVEPELERTMDVQNPEQGRQTSKQIHTGTNKHPHPQRTLRLEWFIAARYRR